MLNTCVRCGKQFEANVKTAVCQDCHIAVCVVCGKEFVLKYPYTAKTCCSKCRGEYRKISGIGKQVAAKAAKTVKERYGVTNAGNLELKPRKCEYCGKMFIPQSNRQKFCKDDHYGPCPVCGKPTKILDMTIGPQACSEECRVKRIKQTCEEKYGNACVLNSEYGQEKRKETCEEKYGVDHFSKTDEFRSKYLLAMNERYGVDYPLQSAEFHSKVAESRKSITAADGTHVDSSYERIVYDFCLRNNLNFEYQIPIEYEYKGNVHTTLIDFKIEGILFEVKGEHILRGYFDYQGVPIAAKLDVYRKHHVVVITGNSVKDMFGKLNSTESNGLKYLNKCPEPLIGVDLALFKHPEFPYRTDRPKCFYDVKVNHQMSVFEAFNDESIRWKMIVNRILYSGGFIDNNQILQALNISRTCKQPSWFSKSFAKKIISKYVTEDVIVDPFAGWGARCDASTELHKIYIGCDLNQELVNWHHENGRFQIKYGDAKEFKYDGKCSVFICPPYQDVEVYFEDQDSQLTQCDWLKICMKNIPNASEYIMVCKVVDEGWEKYIEEVKINKSHFGENNEYVIVIRNGASL